MAMCVQSSGLNGEDLGSDTAPAAGHVCTDCELLIVRHIYTLSAMMEKASVDCNDSAIDRKMLRDITSNI